MAPSNPPDIIRKFAPILHLHPKEGEYCCFPSSAEEIYSRFGHDWESFEKLLEPNELELPTPCYYELWQDEKMTQLRYWFWYNYNRFPRAPMGRGEHLGDWEHVEVRIYDDDYVIWLLSNHLTARLAGRPWGLSLPGFESVKPMLDNDQIHVWVALGSHACYPHPDSPPYCVGGILCDKIENGGAIWETSKLLVDLRDTNFYAFQGRWGDSRAPRSPTNEYNNRWRNAPNETPA